MRRALLRAGFEVAEAPEGHAALALVRAQPFDLVISDVEMPIMDGIALITQLSREYPKLPVILVSGSFDRADHAALDLLRKPFSLQAIQDAALHAVAAAGSAPPRSSGVESVPGASSSVWRRLAKRVAGLSERGYSAVAKDSTDGSNR